MEGIDTLTRGLMQSSSSGVWDVLVQSPDEQLQEVLGTIFKHLEAGTLIDMGSGNDSRIAEMFIHAKTKRYIGVDNVEYTRKGPLPFARFRASDMRSFMDSPEMEALLNNGNFSSINFMFNAINGPIMSNEELHKTLESAVPWLGDNDYIFGVNSPEVREWLLKNASYYDLRPVYVQPSSPFFAFKRSLYV